MTYQLLEARMASARGDEEEATVLETLFQEFNSAADYFLELSATTVSVLDGLRNTAIARQVDFEPVDQNDSENFEKSSPPSL